MASKNAIGTGIAIALGVVVVGGIAAYALKGDSAPTDPRSIVTQQLAGEGDAFVWSFSITQKTAGGLDAVLHGPDGPYADQAAALAAGAAWLKANPVV